MASFQKKSLFFHSLSFIFIVPSIAQTCNSYTFPNHITYAACNNLPTLESSLHWNYHPSTRTVDVAFKKSNAGDSSWIAWAINPTSKGMVGSQAFVAFRKSDGSFRAYTSPITSYATLLQEGQLSFPVHSVSGTYANGSMLIFASLRLPENTTVVNHVWQEGLVSDDGTLKAHAMAGSNLQSFGTLDFVSGKVEETGSKVNSKRTTLRNVRTNSSVLLVVLYFLFVTFRPKNDHRNRIFWNIFHYAIGYSTIVLSILNIFKGFDILHAHMMWKKIYLGIIISLAVIALMLQIWWCKKRFNSKESDDTNQEIPLV
ncbi:cytochrome b561 and DOMON domain-containing protein At5g48750-like [Lotus japonicus]|uniref:cytochrome b561 and DOMON domain-containing protein At5g48750-like n=1 Tax=Lotus japonicus TaxID=34305 RepID=UPI002582E6F6|nr:cytochrome b561 and DOMON domain-containing protein At5g48750-like [Lotus japonicus]